jgi:uncharacterized membrane protein
MTRRIVLFAALFFVALIAGVAFTVWLYFNPAGVSPAFYVETMQHAIGAFTVPLPTLLIPALFFTILSTFLARRDRPSLYLLIAASICVIAVLLITVLGNVPINNRIMTWSINSPPSNWTELSEKWWRFHIVRTIAAIGGLSFLILSALLRHDISK